MGRATKQRTVCEDKERCFISKGIKTKEFIHLSIEAYETIRLIDHEYLSQYECAQMMHVAHTTV